MPHSSWISLMKAYLMRRHIAQLPVSLATTPRVKARSAVGVTQVSWCAWHQHTRRPVCFGLQGVSPPSDDAILCGDDRFHNRVGGGRCCAQWPGGAGNPCLDGTFVKQAMSLTGMIPAAVVGAEGAGESLQADQKRSKKLARDIFSVFRLRATFRLRHSTRGLVSVPESKVPEP